MERRTEVEDRLRRLAAGFTGYVDAYDAATPFTSAQAKAHRDAIALRRAAGGAEAALDDLAFVASLHRTLVAWKIGTRGSRLVSPSEFFEALQVAKPDILALERYAIDDRDAPEDVADRVWRVVEGLGVVVNKSKLVAGTKTLHHVLPDLVVPLDRDWTGSFFRLHAPDWQYNQQRTYRWVHNRFAALARQANPQQYVTGRGWRTSRTKVLDNAMIAFCRRHGRNPVPPDEPVRAVSFSVAGPPPTRSEALSLLGAGHPHVDRVRVLLEAARGAITKQGFTPEPGKAVALDLEVRVGPGTRPADAPTALGGVGAVLQDKASRGGLPHLADLASVWLFRYGHQLKQVSYREVEGADTGYTVSVRVIDV
ncbi:hypothetical protein [Saccharothrix sp. Mg75]|uniref:hypothetical protein n=1 Tax=Saccharothrix sp. Mg75 TaxID=3445357 RepID=UPI003EF06DF5